jgi:hypothetical protein
MNTKGLTDASPVRPFVPNCILLRAGMVGLSTPSLVAMAVREWRKPAGAR